MKLIIQIRDSDTGVGIAGAEIHVRNITRTAKAERMDADIKHDITSGKLHTLNIKEWKSSTLFSFVHYKISHHDQNLKTIVIYPTLIYYLLKNIE